MELTSLNPPSPCARWVQQQATWPQDGEHVVAHHDAETLAVYQAYRPEIGRWATQLGGPAFSFNRMSWVKPSVLPTADLAASQALRD